MASSKTLLDRACKSGRYILAFLRIEDDAIHLDWEMSKFPTDDLPAAKQLVAAEFRKAIKQGPTDDGPE